MCVQCIKGTSLRRTLILSTHWFQRTSMTSGSTAKSQLYKPINVKEMPIDGLVRYTYLLIVHPKEM